MSAAISDIPQHFVAPKFISMFLQGIEVGFILSQQWTFWSRSDSHARTRVLLVFVSVLGLFQMVISAQELWRITVIEIGDWSGVFKWSWQMEIQSLLTALVAMPVQSFMTWRCWILSGRRSVILVMLCPLIISYLAASIARTVRAFIQPSAIVVLSSESYHNPECSDPSVCVCLIIPALLDIILTSISLYQYFRSRSGIINSGFRKVLSSLPLMTWQCAIPPCGCAVAAVILSMTTRIWAATFQDVLGKLYLISLLVSLNAKTYYYPERNSTIAWNKRSKGESIELKETPRACKSPSTSCDKGHRSSELSTLEFTTLSQTGYCIEVDSVLGPITSESEWGDLGSRDSRFSRWAEQYELTSWSFETSRNSTVVSRGSMGSWI